jgi:hypothetical protein
MFSNLLSRAGDPGQSRVFSLRLNAMAVSLLAVAACMVYWPTFYNDFQFFWDDQWMVQNHYTEGGLTADNLKAIFTEFYVGQYAPLNQLHYTLIYALAGYDPFWFHAVGLALHIVNIIVVYFFVARLLTRATGFTAESVVRISLLTALLLAVHPFLVETVAWIAAAKFPIYSLFFFLGLHAYLSFLSHRTVVNYLLCVLCFVLSFGGKEQAVTFPVCALLLDYALNRKFTDKHVWLEKIPFFVLAVFMGLAAIQAEAEYGLGVLSDDIAYPLHQRILYGCYALTEYIIKCLAPVRLSYIYLFPNQVGEAIPARFWIYPAIVAAAGIAFSNFWKNKWLVFGAGFLVINLAMVLHIMPLSRLAIVADRYMYLPGVGLFFVMAYLADRIIVQYPKYGKVVAAFVFLYITALGAYAHERTRAWQNTDTLKKEIKALQEKHSSSHPADSVNMFHPKTHP